MLKEIGVRSFYIGIALDDPQRTTVIFQRQENVLNDIFMNPVKKLLLKLRGIFMRVQK